MRAAGWHGEVIGWGSQVQAQGLELAVGGLALAFHVHAKPRVKGTRSTTLPLELATVEFPPHVQRLFSDFQAGNLLQGLNAPPMHLEDFSRCNSGSMGYGGYSY